MTKILFISQYLNRAGTESFMMSVFRGIDRTRFQIDFLLYTTLETEYSREVEAAGCKVHRVTSRRESPLRWYIELNKFFKTYGHEYHAVHFCGNSLTSIAPLWFAYKYGIPVRIAHAHNSSCRGLHNKILHLLKRGIARRITTHHFACSTLAAKWFFGKHPARIISNGIEVKRFTYDESSRHTKRRELGIYESQKVIGHIGRFVDEKNHTFILDIFGEYVKQSPHAVLMLVGNGPLMLEVEAKATAMGISHNVMLLGERCDVAQLFQAMDLFLMPSTFEGLPFVLIEAQAAGLPCLISDVINRDICMTEGVSYLSLKDSPEVWGQRAQELLDSHVRKDTYSEIAAAGYAISDTIRQLESIY